MDKTVQDSINAMTEALKGAKFVQPFQNDANITMASGYYWSDLTPAVQFIAAEFRQPIYLVPSTPRIVIGTSAGDAKYFKQFDGVDSVYDSIGLEEGKRGGQIAPHFTPKVFSYHHFGREASHTFEADLASGTLTPDARAMKMRALLVAMRLREERLMLFGNNTASGQGGQAMVKLTGLTLVPATSGGHITDGTAVYVRVMAITPQAYRFCSVSAGLKATANRTNMDGTITSVPGGHGIASDSSNQTVGTSGSNLNSIACTWTRGSAFEAAYAVFWGAGDTTTCHLGAIVTTNSYTITTAVGTGTQVFSDLSGDGDCSGNGTEYSGLWAQAVSSGVAEIATLAAGSYLTSDGQGGIVEIDARFESFHNNNFVYPTRCLVHSQEYTDMTKIIPATSTGTMQIVNLGPDGAISGGRKLAPYKNKFAPSGAPGETCEFVLHPEVPPGTMIFQTESLQAPADGVPAPFVIYAQRDYYGLEWPMTTRRYDYGTYFDTLAALLMPFTVGGIVNISKRP